uniref:Uncharacterized protein n=1 Tax=Arundo donax TaxID=35708 RepID=A0A0A9D282_ARUDO
MAPGSVHRAHLREVKRLSSSTACVPHRTVLNLYRALIWSCLCEMLLFYELNVILCA